MIQQIYWNYLLRSYNIGFYDNETNNQTSGCGSFYSNERHDLGTPIVVEKLVFVNNVEHGTKAGILWSDNIEAETHYINFKAENNRLTFLGSHMIV
jgi:hypothetical protein